VKPYKRERISLIAFLTVWVGLAVPTTSQAQASQESPATRPLQELPIGTVIHMTGIPSAKASKFPDGRYYVNFDHGKPLPGPDDRSIVGKALDAYLPLGLGQQYPDPVRGYASIFFPGPDRKVPAQLKLKLTRQPYNRFNGLASWTALEGIDLNTGREVTVTVHLGWHSEFNPKESQLTPSWMAGHILPKDGEAKYWIQLPEAPARTPVAAVPQLLELSPSVGSIQ
jgi:hypothetical protein